MYPQNWNHGLIWNGRDLRRLVELYRKGFDVKKIGDVIGRSASACNMQLNAIRKAELYAHGKDDQSIKDFKLEVK